MLFFILSAIILVIDQVTKFYTVAKIGLGEQVPFIKGFLSFTYLQNTGSAFSLFEDQKWYGYLIMALTVVIAIGICWGIVKYAKTSRWLGFGLALILAGALGNFIDRLHYGFVVDMIQTDFMNFPIFNVADISLCVGVVCIFVYLVIDERKKDKK